MAVKINEKQTKEVFKAKTFVALVPSKALSKKEDELLHGVIVRLREEFWDFKKNCVPKQSEYKFEFKAAELRDLLQLERAKFSKEVETAMLNISSLAMFVKTEEDSSGVPMFKLLKFYKKTGNIKVIFNEVFVDDIINIHGKAFTKISLAQLREFNSKYTRAIYDLVKSSASPKGEINVKFEVKFIRELLNLQKSYKTFNAFKTRVLEPVLKDLASSDLKVKVTFDTKYGTRKIEGLKFTGKIVAPTPDEIHPDQLSDSVFDGI